ncbi:hypothetical protein [Terriglobus saanensis]|nr:hypothetical protein [Terriglobus saanensis]
MTLDIVQTVPLQQTILHQVVPNFTGEYIVELEDPDTFPMWTVTLSLSRYDAGPGFTFMPRGNPNPSHTFHVARLPSRWESVFSSLGELPADRFDPFKKVLSVSKTVDVKNGPIIGDLQAAYDTLAGTQQILAKAALLNLFAVLTDEVDPIAMIPWYSYVRKVVRIDQERFLAEVDPALFENVQTILNELTSTYAAQGFFTEPAADLPLHIPNIPTAYHSDQNLRQIITVKKDYEQGNLQLTLSFLVVDGVAVHLLDCDMDEHRNIILHSFDILAHLVNGGTNPIAMHEYIVEDSAQQSPTRLSTINLGYTLV